MGSLATSYEESVGSCGPPTPHTPTEPSAPRAGPVRRQLDFTGGGGGDQENGDDDDDEFFSCVEDFERGYDEAKRRAPQCVCGRGVCLVELDHQSDRWKYVCPSRPKCKYVAFCEEAYLNQPKTRIHALPSNPCAFNDPGNHIASLGTAVNISPPVTGTATPVSPFAPSTPVKVIPEAAVPTTPAEISPQGARFSGVPVCQCRAGECREVTIGTEKCYVCPILKGQGACSYKVPVRDFPKDIVPWQTAALNTPLKSPVRPCGTPSPIPPNYICYRCREKGHLINDCPKKQQAPRDDRCFKCGVAGHWACNCPQRV